MQQLSPTSRLICRIVSSVDIVILNVVNYIFLYIIDFGMEERGLSGRSMFMVTTLCYLVALYYRGPVLHKRRVSIEEIISSYSHTWVFYILISSVSFYLLYIPFFLGITKGLYYLSVLFFILAWRIIARKILKYYRIKGRNYHRAIFVGSDSNMHELFMAMREDPSTGFRIDGYFDYSQDSDAVTNYLGSVEDVIPYLESEKAKDLRDIFCSVPSSHANEIKPIINYCENHMIRFFAVPNVRKYLKRRMVMEMMGDVPLLTIREEPLMDPGNRIIKRTFDIIASFIFLFTIYPFILLVVAIVIKLQSPGPVYFRQARTGLDGKTFYCLKFRSMHVNADADKVQATKNDPRKYPFGNFMRMTNIDELPQFINVLKGEMSIVGPRPHMLAHTEMYSVLVNKYMVRHLAKPGITGWAQVTGCRGETKEVTDMARRVERDIWYIENWTFMLDLKIMYLTIKNIVNRNDKMAY